MQNMKSTARTAGVFYLLVVVLASAIDAVAYAMLRLSAGNTSLAFFGVYCTLIGWLILKSSLILRFIGVGMIVAGLGWLTLLWPPIVTPLSFIPGMIGEGVLTVWLLVKGVNEDNVAVDNFARAHA